MSVVLARLRAEARWRWRAWLALAVLAGVVGGAVIAALAGARRTDAAYPRLVGVEDVVVLSDADGRFGRS